MKIKIRSLIWKGISLVLIVGLIVAICIGTSTAYFWQMQLDRILCPPITDSEAVALGAKEGQQMAAQVITEGAVLLENKDNVLPLSKDDDRRVNVFGYNSVDWMHGAGSSGSSGRVMKENANSEIIDFLRAMTRYGISYNSELQEIYKSWAAPVRVVENAGAGQLDIKEAPMSIFSDDVLSRAEQYSRTAFVVISRSTAEGVDASTQQPKNGPAQNDDTLRHFLEISAEEEALLTYVGSRYDKTIVLLNAALPMECGFMKTIPGLDALVHVGQTGTQAVSALPALLYGDESFSGRTADTYSYDITEFSAVGAQTDNWLEGRMVTNKSSHNGDAVHTVEYVEGIYVGYKWYETADVEGVWANVDNVYGKGYDGVVQYPFGYGKSYATFDWTVKAVSPSAGSEITEVDETTRITVDVEVTNTSDVYSGKEVVQAYATVPYYEGGIEKSHVSLVGFAKTQKLAPGSSETVTVEIDVEELLSYDCYDENGNGHVGWELEHSDADHKYLIKLMNNSHEIRTVDFATDTDSREGVPAVIEYDVPEDLNFDNDFYTDNPVGNLFTGEDAIDGASIDGSDGNVAIPWMKRENFAADANYSIPERTMEIYSRTLSDKEFANYDYSVERAEAWDNAAVDEFGDPVPDKAPNWGVDSGLKVADGVMGGEIYDLGYTLGADYNAPEWDAVLDQIPVEEAAEMLGPCISGNVALPSIGKPALQSLDSISQICGFTSGNKGTGNPNPVMLAQTFNKDLMHQFGLAFGQDMNSLNVQSVYGPGGNLHRSPRGGRNFEYYSEDTYLTGVTCCMVIRGIQDRGCSVELKHFAVNEVERDRGRLCTYMTEQTLRETYLRPFQRAVQEENCTGIMSAYNNIGSIWAGGSAALLTGVLRREWGFNGLVDTDWTSQTGFVYGEIAEQLRAGGDLGMGFGLNATDKTLRYDETSTPRLQHRIRDAVHHTLYSWLSAKYQGKQYVEEGGETSVFGFTIDSWKWWRVVLPILDLFVVCACAIWAIAVFVPGGKKPLSKKKAPAGGDDTPPPAGGGDAAVNVAGDITSAGAAAAEDTDLPGAAQSAPPGAESDEELSSPPADIGGGAARTYDEEYDALPGEMKDRVNAVLSYALGKKGATEIRGKHGVTVRAAGGPLVKIAVKRGAPVAYIKLENDDVRTERRSLGLRPEYTKVKLRDEKSVGTACRLIDIVEQQRARYKEEAKDRRREARRARERQADAEAGNAEENAFAGDGNGGGDNG